MQLALARPPKGGVRQIVAIEPDNLAAVTDQLGPLALEEFVAQFASVIADSFKPGDIIGRLGDCCFAALMERGIRINCTMPAPIDTPMLKDFKQIAGDAVLNAFAKAKGRFSTPEEQALPLILLNSDAASFVSGVCLPVDAGLAGGLATGVLNIQQMIAEASAAA